MFSLSIEKSPKQYARTVGLFYLIIAIIGGISIGYLPSELIDLRNPITTAKHIIENSTLYNLMILGDIAVLILEVVLTTMLYRLFKTTSHSLTLIATFSRFTMGIIMGINLINYIIPITIYTQSEFLNNFTHNQQVDVALLFLNLHKAGEYTWQLFFAIHLIVLGVLVLKSNYTPKLLGYLILIGSIGYGFQSIFYFLNFQNSIANSFVAIFLTTAVIGELGFTFWLLIKGIKEENGIRKIIY